MNFELIEKCIHDAAVLRCLDFSSIHSALRRSKGEGFKEALVVFDVLSAFRNQKWMVFPEFPVSSGGSIDAVFCNEEGAFVIFESKRFYRGVKDEILKQRTRMMELPARSELKRFFNASPSSLSYLWVCDNQEPTSRALWDSLFPENENWKSGEVNVCPEYSYSWIYAFKTEE